MKNFKKIALGLLVAVMAVGFSAFTTAKTQFVTDWYSPISNSLSPGSPAALNFSNYNSTPLANVPTCDGEEVVCAARFPDTNEEAVQIKAIDQE